MVSRATHPHMFTKKGQPTRAAFEAGYIMCTPTGLFPTIRVFSTPASDLKWDFAHLRGERLWPQHYVGIVSTGADHIMRFPFLSDARNWFYDMRKDYFPTYAALRRKRIPEVDIVKALQVHAVLDGRP